MRLDHRLIDRPGFTSYQTMKRVLDVLMALAMAPFALLLLIPSAIVIRLTSPGPALFKQSRLGWNGRVFTVYKLRTMTHVKRRASAEEVHLHDDGVTAVGRLLRRTKIDELPQLWNVLNGDMSFVGPRPSLPDLQERFDENGWARLLVRPGLTGLAQIRGGIFLSWPERWVWDRRYVETADLSVDFQILVRTVAVVLKGEQNFKAEA